MGMCICMYIYLYLHVFLWKALCTRECVCTCICVCVRAHSLLLVCGCAHRAKWRLQCLFRRQDSGSRLSASTLQHIEKHIHVIVLFLVHKEKKERAQAYSYTGRYIGRSDTTDSSPWRWIVCMTSIHIVDSLKISLYTHLIKFGHDRQHKHQEHWCGEEVKTHARWIWRELVVDKLR